MNEESMLKPALAWILRAKTGAQNDSLAGRMRLPAQRNDRGIIHGENYAGQTGILHGLTVPWM